MPGHPERTIRNHATGFRRDRATGAMATMRVGLEPVTTRRSLLADWVRSKLTRKPITNVSVSRPPAGRQPAPVRRSAATPAATAHSRSCQARCRTASGFDFRRCKASPTQGCAGCKAIPR